MKQLNSKILLVAISLLAIGLFGAARPAQAVDVVDNLVVQFENAPLFKDIDAKPCDATSRWIRVTNNSGQTQPIAIKAYDFTNLGVTLDLSHALSIVIKQSATDLYGGSSGFKTLYDFYQAGEIYLSDLANGATVQYDIIISFPCDKGNEWQEKTTGFNLEIGFQTQNAPLPPPTTNPVLTSFGGGMGGGGPLPASDAYQSWLEQQAPGEVKGASTGFVSDQPAGEVLGASTFKGAPLAGTGFSLWELFIIIAMILTLVGLRSALRKYNKKLVSEIDK